MNRRFVNLLVRKLNGGRPAFNVHRIDTARLFSPTRSPRPAAVKKDPAALGLAPARLPPAAASFDPRNGSMDFIALNDDIIAVDQDGQTLLYDGEVRSLLVMKPILHPRRSSISLTVGNDLYVMARELGLVREVHHFQVLRSKVWRWFPLKSLPLDCLDILDDPRYKYKLGLQQLDPFEFGAYTAFSDSEIWISTLGLGTYSFNTDTIRWSKMGDWALQFSGRAQYVAEHGLWFGFSDGQLCAADLRQQPPALPLRKFPLLKIWEEPPLSEAWTPTASTLFPLGSGKICIARIFKTTNGRKLIPAPSEVESFALLDGVEVVKDAVTGSFEIIKHNSVCYMAGVGENMVKLL